MTDRTKNIFSLAVFCLALTVIYRDVFAGLWQQWTTDDNYAHGFLIIPISLYLAWERRHRFQAAPSRPSMTGILVALGSLGSLLVGVLGAELFLTRISLLGTIVGAVLFVYGWQRLRMLFFPLVFLFLMIPIPRIVFDQIVFPLQLFAASFGEMMLQVVKVPVFRDGNLIFLANTTLEVAEACSGIRSLITLLTLGIMFAYFADSRSTVRAAIVLSTVPVAVMANGLRLLGTGLAVQYYGPETAEGFFHAFSGWIIFLLALLMLLVLQHLIVWIAPATRQPAAENMLISAANVRESISARMAILTFSLAIGAVYLGYASKTEAVPIREPLSRIPMEIGHWRGHQNLPLSDKILAVLGVTEYLTRSYANSGPRPVDLYIGYYQSQRMGETIHSPKNCLPGSGWMPISSAQIEIPVGDVVILVNEYLIQKGTEKALVLYWYHNAGRVIASEYLAKFYLVLDAVRKNRTDGALVRVVAPIIKSEEASKRDAVDFVKSLFPLLSRHLPA